MAQVSWTNHGAKWKKCNSGLLSTLISKLLYKQLQINYWQVNSYFQRYIAAVIPLINREQTSQIKRYWTIYPSVADSRNCLFSFGFQLWLWVSLFSLSTLFFNAAFIVGNDHYWKLVVVCCYPRVLIGPQATVYEFTYYGILKIVSLFRIDFETMLFALVK